MIWGFVAILAILGGGLWWILQIQKEALENEASKKKTDALRRKDSAGNTGRSLGRATRDRMRGRRSGGGNS
jgi:hypothetical protein